MGLAQPLPTQCLTLTLPISVSAVSPGHGAGLLPARQPAAQRVHPQQSVPGTVSGPGA